VKLFELPSQFETYLLGLAVFVNLHSLIGHANINGFFIFLGSEFGPAGEDWECRELTTEWKGEKREETRARKRMWQCDK